MPNVGKKMFGYSAGEKLKAQKYAKKTGKKMTIAGGKSKGTDQKRVAGARAQAQAKRSERAAGARAKARAKAARGRR